MNPEDRKEARQYAWQYFSLHADQRMRLFNFFLLLSGLLMGALSAVKQITPGTNLAVLLPLIQTFSSFIFWRLDERSRTLIKNAEIAIKYLDALWGLESDESGEPHVLCLFARDNFRTGQLKNRWWAKYFVPVSYSRSFKLTYIVVGGLGMVLAAWELVH